MNRRTSNKALITTILVINVGVIIIYFWFLNQNFSCEISHSASENKEVQTQEVVSATPQTLISEEEETCSKKYILLSTQRSGSTWTCDLLRHQEGISCGKPKKNNEQVEYTSELLIQYSSLLKNETNNVEWSKYEQDLNNAFDEACKGNPSLSIGFKLMYSQVPLQFLEDGKLETYLRENNVSIIHLVREAKILKMVSIIADGLCITWCIDISLFNKILF